MEEIGKSVANQLQIGNLFTMSELQQNEITQNGAIVENSQTSAISPQTEKPWLFQPGQSGNPSGRPKSRLISEELKEILASEDATTRTGAQRLGQKLMGHAEQEKDGYLSLAAIKEITDRVEGKPVQTSNVRGIIAMVPAETVMSALDSWADDSE